MLVVEGTYENGELHLNTPVAYAQPVRVRVEFLDEYKLAIRPRFSWDAALARTTDTAGVSVADEVVAERNERG